MKILVVIYLVYWIALSERLTYESILVGLFISFAVLLFNTPTISQEKIINTFKFKSLKQWFFFIIILVAEIIKSNIHVAKIVLSPKLNISPRVVDFQTKIKSDTYKSILANSITLTPGTLTIYLDDTKLLVHCLEEESTASLSDNKLEKILQKAEEIS